MANPISWVKGKFKKEPKKVYALPPPSSDTEWAAKYNRAEEERQRLQDELAKTDELRRQEEASRVWYQSRQYAKEEAAKTGEYLRPTKEEVLSKMTDPKLRKKYEKAFKKSEAREAEIQFQSAARGLPTEEPASYIKTYMPGHNREVIDPITKKKKTEWVEPEYKITKIAGRKFSPAEMSALARQAQLGEMQFQEEKAKFAAAKRERVLGPVAAVGQSILGAAASGVAGAAGGMRMGYGRSTPMQRASEAVVPQPGGSQSELYRINRPAAPMLRQPAPGFNPGTASLAHLRNIILAPNVRQSPVPGSRVPVTSTRQPQVPQAKTVQGISVKKYRLW